MMVMIHGMITDDHPNKEENLAGIAKVRASQIAANTKKERSK